jgi:hypothetical protein
LIETLLAGLRPGRLRDRSVNASARDGLNMLLQCNITEMWQYSVHHHVYLRNRAAHAVEQAWARTVEEVRERRAAVARKPTAREARRAARIAGLITALAGSDENERREAEEMLRLLEEQALKPLHVASRSRNNVLADRAAALRKSIITGLARHNPGKATFDLEVAERLIPEQLGE